MIQDVDKKSNRLKLNYVADLWFQARAIGSDIPPRGSRGMGISAWRRQNDEHVCQAPAQKALSPG
jgi:hypothetical protein